MIHYVYNNNRIIIIIIIIIIENHSAVYLTSRVYKSFKLPFK